ncbi:MAG: pentapeptide repeat-containing protein [Pseudanabaenaceae cyanobacterium bins.39]|nr:pentapeptide repeat-containing protein [Pseudanabaenaceae cyanobacterium bins.39]
MGHNQNFANQDLRDRSFKGKSLIGADFNGSDIRGCDFGGAQLQLANFANVRSGYSQRQLIVNGLITYILALLFAFTAMVIAILLLNFLLCLAIIVFGLGFDYRQMAFNGITLGVVIVYAISFTIAFILACMGGLVTNHRKTIFTVAICLVTAFVEGYLGSGMVKILMGGAFNVIFGFLNTNAWLGSLLLLVIEILQGIGSLYLFRWVISIPRSIVGTKFKQANLTQASFQNAVLVGCDFSQAIVTDVDWQRAQIWGCKLPANFDMTAVKVNPIK